jgi:hypothetical protein
VRIVFTAANPNRGSGVAWDSELSTLARSSGQRCFCGHPVDPGNNQVNVGGNMTTAAPLTGLEHLRKSWGWFLALGIVMVVLGVIALTFIPAATLGSVLVLGWLMFASGILDGVYAFHARGWGGVLLHVLGAVLGVIVGVACGYAPGRGRTGMDNAVCRVFHRYRAIPHHCRDSLKILPVGMGRVRWSCDTCAWLAALGIVASFGDLVPGICFGNRADHSRLDHDHVRTRSPRVHS